MWQPGFAPRERRPARLVGYHRDYCMVSTRNRGTEANPGLVLSVCPGGDLVGVAFRYEREDEAAVLAALDEREGVHRAHMRAAMPIHFLDGSTPNPIPCWTYLPIVTADNYDCRMPVERRAELIAQGQGKIGSSLEYLSLLLDELNKLDVSDPHLNELYRAVQRRGALDAAGK
jgi:cation transport protein ChaC